MINSEVFDKLPDYVQDFVIEHEKAHISLDTNSELLADELAFNNYVGKRPQSLKKSIMSLADGLTFDRDEHHLRLYKQIERALTYDWEVNKNPKAKQSLNNLKSQGMDFLENKLDPNAIDYIENQYSGNFYDQTHVTPYISIVKPKTIEDFTVTKLIKAKNLGKAIHLPQMVTKPLIQMVTKPLIYNDLGGAGSKPFISNSLGSAGKAAPRRNFILGKLNRSHFIKADASKMVTKPLAYNPADLAWQEAERQFMSGGGGGDGYDYDTYTDDVEDTTADVEDTTADVEKATPDTEKTDKFLGMPKKTGIAVTVVVGLLVIGVISYFVFFK